MWSTGKREGSRALACDARIYVSVSVSVSALLCAVLTASENSDPVERLHGARGVAKLTAVRAAEFAKRLDLSKDTVLEAQMQQRRWERALGVAIREGQERGEIATQATGRPRGSTFQESTSVKLSDLATSTELHGKRGDGIYALTDNATDDQFESALTTARDEGRQRR